MRQRAQVVVRISVARQTAPLRGDLQPQTRHDTASLAQFSNAFGAAAECLLQTAGQGGSRSRSCDVAAEASISRARLVSVWASERDTTSAQLPGAWGTAVHSSVVGHIAVSKAPSIAFRLIKQPTTQLSVIVRSHESFNNLDDSWRAISKSVGDQTSTGWRQELCAWRQRR
jgi:hypothetical protein